MLRASFLLLLSLCSATTRAQAWDVPLDSLLSRVDRRPDDPAVRHDLAERLIAEGALTDAVVHLRWLTEASPEDSARHLRLARVLSWTGQQLEAIAAYDALLEIAPDHAEGTFELAQLLTWNGAASRAVRLLAPMADRQPEDREIQALYAFALHGARRVAEARHQYDRALRLAPDDVVLLAESGILERWEGDWAVGRHRMRRALQLGVEEEVAKRVQSVLEGLARAIAPRVALSMEHAVDSNGLTRTRIPSHTLIQLSPAWSAGVSISQVWLSQSTSPESLSSLDAAATFVSPYAVFSPGGPLSLRISAGIQDVHREGSGVSGAVEGEWRRTGPRFVRSILRLQSDASVDGVRALGQGLRTTALVSETYAEPLPDWGFGVGAATLWYSDGNTRLNVSMSTRLMLVEWGPLEMGLTGGGGYEHTAEAYASSDPYWTPQNLVTVLGGGVMAWTPVKGFKLEPAVTVAHQRDAYSRASSVGVRLQASLNQGRHRAGFLVEESGSEVYSSQRVGLHYEVALW